MKNFIVGTRGSELAMLQANWVVSQFPHLGIPIRFSFQQVATLGDQKRHLALTQFKGVGIFTNEIEQSLAEKSIDFAVHSLKDLPLQLANEFVIASLPKREDPRDVFVSRDGRLLKELVNGARIGTSSLRRTAQLKAAYPHLQTLPIRGPIDQRIEQLFTGDLDGIILAAAGLHRLQKTNYITEYLPIDLFTPAAGQGALAIQCRKNDNTTIDLLQSIEDPHVKIATEVERSFVYALDQEDKGPIGAYAESTEKGITLYVSIVSNDGETTIRYMTKGKTKEQVVADALRYCISKGAKSIIQSASRDLPESI